MVTACGNQDMNLCVQQSVMNLPVSLKTEFAWRKLYSDIEEDCRLLWVYAGNSGYIFYHSLCSQHTVKSCALVALRLQ